MNKLSSQIFINGCGPVGLTLAKCLALSPYIQSIIMLDRKIPSTERKILQTPSQRVYSLNGPTLQLYNNIGVLDKLRMKGEMSQIQVISKQANQFINWSDNHSNLVQNDQLIYALMNSLTQNHSNKVKFIQNQIQSLDTTGGFCDITLKDQSNVQTKLVVGSDGNKSKVKELAGINTYGWSYRQRGIVCSMKIDSVIPNFTGYQIYHDKNVLALLPLWENYLSLVWSVGIPDFQYLMNLSDQDFKDRINNVIKNSNFIYQQKKDYIQIPEIKSIQNKRLAFPLSTLQSEFYTKDRLALIGDAAHTIHPMAGLGVNSGIMDSIFLANNVIKNIKAGNDIGDLISLSQYQAEAKSFNYKNSIGMEGLKKFFQTNLEPLNYLKGLGLQIFQNSQSLKELAKNIVQGQKIRYQWQYSQ